MVAAAGCNGGQSGPEDDQGEGSGDGDAGTATPGAEEAGADPAFHDKITAPAPEPEDHFGFAVALTGKTVFVGANRDDVENGSNAGSVHVFRRSDGTWTHRSTLSADDGNGQDRFGSALAVSDTVALVGARQHDHSRESDAGAVYAFERVDGSWTRRSKVVADDAARLDRFGTSVALSGDIATVGAPTDEHPNGSKAGAVYHFGRSSGSWEYRNRIAPEGGKPGGRFGAAIVLTGDTLLVGAPHDVDEGLNDPGVAYVFVRSGDGWTQEATLVRGDANGDDGDDTDDRFGAAVTLAGEGVAVVGAPTDEEPNGMEGGSAYVFERSGGSWREVTKLSARHGRAEDNYGLSVAAGADLAAVGVPREDLAEGRSAGATHLYTI